MLWPPVRLPSFQPCFTYRPTPICSDDRGKPKGRLFLIDLSILFSTQTIERIWIYIYIYISNRKRREKSHFRSSQFRDGEPTVADTRRHLFSLSLFLFLFAKEIAGLLSRIGCCRVEFRSRDIDFPFHEQVRRSFSIRFELSLVNSSFDGNRSRFPTNPI